MPFEEIKILLQDNIGLHTDSIGDASVERAIKQRMKTLEIHDGKRYLTKLLTDHDELNELVEEVVVPETWFFRNQAPFETMMKYVKELKNKDQVVNTKIRILSIPCSTGEEPYSIAITLLKNGISEKVFEIDAVDISKAALRKARRAIYGKHSFRETGGVPEAGYFQEIRSGYQVLPQVKENVNFIEGNILKDIIAPEPEYYDIIFCRNLLIYFNRSTQKIALEKLNSILKKNGILFMGHAETVGAGKDLFTRIEIPNSFAYKKKSMMQFLLVENKEKIEPVNDLEKIYNQLVNVTLKDMELSKKYKEYSYKKDNKIEKNTTKYKNDILKSVEKLVEQGNYSDAYSLCVNWLDDNPEGAKGYYLLGLISSLEGNNDMAKSFLKKAIYLDPNHHKALGLSALLAEQMGDTVDAESLRFRESRARKRAK